MADFLNEVGDVIKRHQVDDSTAGKIIEDIRKSFGGGQIYVRKKTAEKVKDCHAEIKKRFTGDNHTELSREFGLGTSQIYRFTEF